MIRLSRRAGLVACLSACVVVAALPLAGCGVRPTGTVYAGEAPIATGQASPQSQLYFLRQGVPTPVSRPVSPWDTQLVFDALLAGPTPTERSKGLVSELTDIRRISVLDVGGGTLIIETDPPAVRLSPAAFAQLRCTGSGLPDRPILKAPYLGRELQLKGGRLGCDAAPVAPQPTP